VLWITIIIIYSNTYRDLYFTLTSFDSDITNPTLHNFNQPSMLDWSYLNQYYPQSQYYEQDWKNYPHFSPSQWEYSSPSHIVIHHSNIQLQIFLVMINPRRKV